MIIYSEIRYVPVSITSDPSGIGFLYITIKELLEAW
nr:MAG TPA: hypothetical protein [Caudoviricetes sp.]